MSFSAIGKSKIRNGLKIAMTSHKHFNTSEAFFILEKCDICISEWHWQVIAKSSSFNITIFKC